MRLETVQVEKELTVEELLESKGLNPKLYFVAVDGEHVKQGQKIRAGQKTQIIPIVKGG